MNKIIIKLFVYSNDSSTAAYLPDPTYHSNVTLPTLVTLFLVSGKQIKTGKKKLLALNFVIVIVMNTYSDTISISIIVSNRY